MKKTSNPKKTLSQLMLIEKLKSTAIYLGIIVLLAYMALSYLNVPTGSTKEVVGTVINGSIVTPRFNASYIKLEVLLHNGITVNAIAPTHISIKKNKEAILQLQQKMITKSDFYRFHNYLDNGIK